MIIQCINCSKKFDVKSDLIPDQGRNIQCGSCNHVWFFNKNQQIILDKDIPLNKDKKEIVNEQIIKPEKNAVKSKKKQSKRNITPSSFNNEKNSALVKYENVSNFTLGKFLSYILVAIISFISLIILLDTLKLPLDNFFPNLEFLLFNFFETIKDITLFIKDLI